MKLKLLLSYLLLYGICCLQVMAQTVPYDIKVANRQLSQNDCSEHDLENMTFKSLVLTKVLTTETHLKLWEREQLTSAYYRYSIKDNGDYIIFVKNNDKTAIFKMAKKKRRAATVQESKDFLEENIKIAYTYEIASDSSLLLETEIIELRNKTNDVFNTIPLKRQLYNSLGKPITLLPIEANIVRLSPDRQYFYAYGNEEEFSEFLYFYKINGELLCKQPIKPFAAISYSNNGEYVQVNNGIAQNFYVFTKRGDYVLGYNCQKLFNKIAETTGIYISNDGNSFLTVARETSKIGIENNLSLGYNTALFSCEGRLLWERPLSATAAQFYENRGIIAVAAVNIGKNFAGSTQKRMLQIINIANGSIIDEIKNVEKVLFINQKIVIKKGEQYYVFNTK